MKITNEEAIQTLKDIYPSQKQIVTGEYPHVAESIDLAIEALEKQIPKEPIKLKAMTYKRCPVCKNNVESLMEQHGYCPSCGQNIDWEELK